MALSIAILSVERRRGGLRHPIRPQRNTKKRPKNGSGRKAVGQIRGASTYVNAARRQSKMRNSAIFWLI
jgi:hypothetical protein